MKLLTEQQFQDYFYIFLGGFLGFLASLFFLHFIHIMTIGEFAGIEGKIDIVSFFRETAERQAASLGILLSFSFLGIVLGTVEILRRRIQDKKKMIRLLERINQTKTEFISIASHQLRAPLTAIKWSLKMLLKEDFGQLNSQQRRILLRDIDTNERLIILIGTLLDISRIEQQRFEVLIKSISLDEAKKVIESAVNELKSVAKKKGLSLDFVISRLPENRIFIDSEKITQVIQNLLENAITYTSKGGTIRIRLEEENNNLLFHLSDTGIGIPKKEQEKIFTKFFRAKNARQRQSGGMGLGLYLCKTLIEMQEGKIWFVSKENKGTTFSFSLPLRGRISAEEFLRKL